MFKFFVMKKILFILAILVSTSGLFVSCEKEELSFDEELLIGKWRSDNLYYKYLSDGSGYTWDTNDDVTEEEAQAFTWTLKESELKQLHMLEIGGIVPKVYTVTELTSTTLKYKDDFGKSFTFSKVSN
jgi:hypothetical protein